MAPAEMDQNRALVIVESGQARAVIVTAENPPEAALEGASLLQQTLKQVSGATIPVKSENQLDTQHRNTQDQITIFVGESEGTKKLNIDSGQLGSGGIMIKTVGSSLVLLGRDDEETLDPRGTYYAVTAFLEKYIGVRRLWPGPVGEVVPKSATVSIPEIDDKYTPPLRQRRARMAYSKAELTPRRTIGAKWLGFSDRIDELGVYYYENVGKPGEDWLAWHRLGGQLHKGSIGGHAFMHLWDKYGKDHPEWFALNHAGSRDQSANPERARLCKSNPELIKAIANEVIEQLDENPDYAVSLSPNDGSGGEVTWCICDRCRAWDAPEGPKRTYYDKSLPEVRYEYVSLTDRVIHFWNAIIDEVVKVHPNARFVVDAYSHYSDPPVRARLRPNVVVRSVLIEYHNDEAHERGRRNWDLWNEAGANQFWRPNYLGFSGRQGTFVGYTRKLGEDIAYLARRKMEGTDLDTIFHHWSTHGLVYYITAKLLWDPFADVEALVDDYCQAGFGPAAPMMKQYYDAIETLTDEYAREHGATHRDHPGIDPVVIRMTDSMVEQLNNLLNEAEKIVEGSDHKDEIKARLAFVRKGYEWSVLNARIFQWRRRMQDGEQVDQDEIRSLMNTRYEMMRDIVESDPLALNVFHIGWGEGARLEQSLGLTD